MERQVPVNWAAPLASILGNDVFNTGEALFCSLIDHTSDFDQIHTLCVRRREKKGGGVHYRC